MSKDKSQVQQEVNAEIEALENWMIEHLTEVCASQEKTRNLTIASFEKYDLDGEDLVGIAIADDDSKIHFRIKPDKTELGIEGEGDNNADG